MHDLQPGDPQRIGPYEVLSRLGDGATGRVYLASAGLRVVAVKLVHPERADEEGFRARLREAVARAAQLEAPSTLPPLDADLDAPAPWLATAYVPGPSLATSVTATGPLPPEALHVLAAALARAVARIHAAGLVHGAITPADVLLGPERPYLTDLGIAAARAAPADEPPGSTLAADVLALGRVIDFAAGGGPGLAVLARPVRRAVAACLAEYPADRPSAAWVAGRLRSAPVTAWPPPAVAALDPTPGWLNPAMLGPDGAGPPGPDAALPDRAEAPRTESVRPVAPAPAAAGPDSAAGPVPPGADRRSLLLGAGVLAIVAVTGLGSRSRPEPLPIPRIAVVSGPGPQPLPVTPFPESRELWSVEAIDPGSDRTALRVTADSVYVGGDGSVVALDVLTGDRRWRVDAPPAGAGLGASSVALAVDGGTVYATTYSTMHAIDAASGRLRWTTPLPTALSTGFTEVGAGGGRLCATAGSTLLRLDPGSGRPVWTHEVPTGSAASPVAVGDRFLVSDGASITAVADDGRLLWRHDDGRTNPTGLAVDDSVGAVYACVDDDEGTLLALDLTSGAVRWSTKTGERPPSSASPPAVTDGIVAVLSSPSVVAYDGATGAVRWQAPGRGATAAGVGAWPVASDGLVYSTSIDATVHAFDATTGAETWASSSTAYSLRSVAVGPGVVLATDGSGQITAFWPG